MAHAHTTDAQDEHGASPGAARYWIVFAALIAGTILTLLTSRIHLPGVLHIGVALVIASVKSMLVVLFFMHLWDHGGANRLVFGTSIFFVVLLIGLTVMDNATRFELANPGHGDTLRMTPPSRRVDTPPAQEPGHDVPTGAPSGDEPRH
jgi:cytochrome c oxidase subunit 4